MPNSVLPCSEQWIRQELCSIVALISDYVGVGLIFSKELRNELLNKKEERENKVIGKVKRYRPGVVGIIDYL